MRSNLQHIRPNQNQEQICKEPCFLTKGLFKQISPIEPFKWSPFACKTMKMNCRYVVILSEAEPSCIGLENCNLWLLYFRHIEHLQILHLPTLLKLLDLTHLYKYYTTQHLLFVNFQKIEFEPALCTEGSDPSMENIQVNLPVQRTHCGRLVIRHQCVSIVDNV